MLVLLLPDMILKGRQASSNAPLPAIKDDLHKYYLSRGVPPEKLLLGLPLYGYSFPCEENSSMQSIQAGAWAATANGKAPPCRVPTTAVAGWQIGLGTIFEKRAAGITTSAGRDAASGSAFLEYMETHHQPLGRHQVWFEDAQSLALKGRGLRSELGLAGVATWSADALWNAPPADSQSIWEALGQG